MTRFVGFYQYVKLRLFKSPDVVLQDSTIPTIVLKCTAVEINRHASALVDVIARIAVTVTKPTLRGALIAAV